MMGYSQDTQILTENGWKYLHEIHQLEERIATFNPDTEQIEYHIANGSYVHDFKGLMVHFHTSRQDILVAPEQSMWNCMDTGTNKIWSKRRAKDFLNLARADFRSTGKKWLLPESEGDSIEFAVVKTYQNVVQLKYQQ
jgi:hypothetical protein